MTVEVDPDREDADNDCKGTPREDGLHDIIGSVCARCGQFWLQR